MNIPDLFSGDEEEEELSCRLSDEEYFFRVVFTMLQERFSLPVFYDLLLREYQAAKRWEDPSFPYKGLSDGNVSAPDSVFVADGDPYMQMLIVLPIIRRAKLFEDMSSEELCALVDDMSLRIDRRLLGVHSNILKSLILHGRAHVVPLQ